MDDWIRSEGWRNQKEEYQFNHTEFLNICQKQGIHVMIGLPVNSSAIFKANGDFQPLGLQQKQLFVDTAERIGSRLWQSPGRDGIVCRQ